MPDDEDPEDEDADDDRGDAVEDVEHEPQERCDPRPRVLRHVDRHQHCDRDGDRDADRDDQRAPDERIRNPTRLAEERPGLREEVPVELAAALDHDRAEHESQHRDRQSRREHREGAEEPLLVLAPRKVARRDGQIEAGPDLVAHTPLRCFSNRRTTTWAATFVTSEMTMRIAAR